MISVQDVRELVKSGFPDAEIDVNDMTGTMDHFEITVRSKVFAGKSLIDQHKMVFKILDAEMKDRIHAVKLHTKAL